MNPHDPAVAARISEVLEARFIGRRLFDVIDVRELEDVAREVFAELCPGYRLPDVQATVVGHRLEVTLSPPLRIVDAKVELR